MNADTPRNTLARELERLGSLFENASDRERFLTEIVTRVRDHLSVRRVAMFAFLPQEDTLAFRAGADADGVWTPERCAGEGVETRFDLDDSAVGRAFRQSNVVRMPDHDKLLVPLARGPQRFGVLLIQGTDGAAEEALSDTAILELAAQIGDTLDDASVLVDHPDAGGPPKRIRGQRASHGVAVGRAVLFWSQVKEDLLNNDTDDGIPDDGLSDTERFDRALNRSLEQLEELENADSSGLAEVSSLIFGAHRLMLRDESFTGRIRSLIEDGTAAPAAIRSVVEEYADRFARMSEARLAEKAQDVRDLGYRLLTNLRDRDGGTFSWEGRIALARHIFPSDLARLAVEGVAGVVLMGAGVTAHISILASSLGVPVLITEDPALQAIGDGTHLVLDADGEQLLVALDRKEMDRWIHNRARDRDTPRSFHIRGRTADNQAVRVMANVNLLKDAINARTQGAEGIGLYRSEFPFLLKNDFLSEEQQFRIYRSIVLSHRGKPVDLRTTDIGGDKLLQGRERPEDNPFLGVRGIRFSLANREMFGEQLRAMLRAGANADLGIMIPMVSGAEEVVETREEVQRAIQQLRDRGVPHNDHPRLGAMVELPAAAISVEELAAETDFLSIGTNDLTMYLLAVDRTNEHLSHLYRTYHPTVLRTVNQIVAGARTHRVEVSVCGDAAADPVMARFFVGIGIRSLSVGPDRIEETKRQLGEYTVADAETTAREMLAIGRVSEMERYLRGQGFPA